MAIRKKRESRDQRRYTRSSTKKGFVLRRPAHLGWMIAAVLAAAAVVAVALVWGNYLKAESDAYRQQMELGEWTLDPEVPPAIPVTVPDIRAVAIKPEGNVGDILIAGDCQGVIMTLNAEDGTLLYSSAIGAQAGMTVHAEAISPADDVARVSKRGLRVICAFTVTWHRAEDAAARTYLRGLELALLREYAEAGMNDLLLFGLPAGNDESDAVAVAFLQDLRALLADLPIPPAVGVALPLEAFSSDGTDIPAEDGTVPGLPADTPPLYAGNVTPARLLTACDFLAADMRTLPPDGVAEVLPHIRYAYVRYALRLLVDKNTPEAAEEALSHGFERVFEMEPPAKANH